MSHIGVGVLHEDGSYAAWVDLGVDLGVDGTEYDVLGVDLGVGLDVDLGVDLGVGLDEIGLDEIGLDGIDLDGIDLGAGLDVNYEIVAGVVVEVEVGQGIGCGATFACLQMIHHTFSSIPHASSAVQQIAFCFACIAPIAS